jgi:hypothetical protein
LALVGRAQTDVQLWLSQPVKRFDVLLPLLLAGYLWLGRTFAWFHIPGTPIFVGEIVLVFGIVGMVRILSWPPLWERSNGPFLLVLFVGWGLMRMIPTFFDDPIIALRDGAIFIYAVVALVVLYALVDRPHVLPRWFKAYKSVIPLTLIWLPASSLGELVDIGNVPDSDVSLTDFPVHLGQVHTLLILAFVWLVWTPRSSADHRWRLWMSALALVGLAALASRNRGGFIAVCFGGALLLALYPAKTRLIVTFSRLLLVVAVITVVINPTIDVGRREISLEQFTDNVASLVNPAEGSELEGTISWRLEHWGKIWEGVNREAPLVGHGFNINIAELYDIPQVDIGLRNAHNSHLTIISRMGWIGMVIWLTLWSTWLFELNATRRRFRTVGLDRLAGLASWAMIGCTGFHVEAFFNPSMEGPHGAFWLWSLFALGVFLVIVSRAHRRSARSSRPGAGLVRPELLESGLAEI